MATSDDQTVPIPEPQGLPLLGNIGAIDNEFPLGSLLSMASKYGKFSGVFFFSAPLFSISMTDAMMRTRISRRNMEDEVPGQVAGIRFNAGVGQ